MPTYIPKRGPLAGQSFGSEYRYRDAMARRQGYSGYREQQATRAEARAKTGTSYVRPAARAKEGGEAASLRTRITAAAFKGRGKDARQRVTEVYEDAQYEHPELEPEDFFYH